MPMMKIVKEKKKWVAVAALAVLVAIACGAANRKDGKAGPLKPLSYDPQFSLAPLVETVSPAVVNIKTSTTITGIPGFGGPNSFFEFFFGPRGRPDPFRERKQTVQAAGSGFIIDADGLVVTNHHVVKDADEIEVQLSDDQVFEAAVVGSDERTDMALLKLKNAKKLPTVKFGDSDKLRVGDRVVAIGNPFGLDHSVTQGIVSAKERVIGAGPYDDFIQTDASINPGNSGGPLFDLSGLVVGINTAIVPAGEGIGFAIPSNLASEMIDSLKKSGKVVRGWLGIMPQPLTDELAKALGVKDTGGALVANVQPDSPAEKGGLKQRDVIVEIDGKKLKNGRQIFPFVARLEPGKKADFGIIRDGKKMTLKIEIGDNPEDQPVPVKTDVEKDDSTKSIHLGLKIVPLDDPMKQRLGAKDLNNGVVIVSVSDDSPLYGVVQGGDVIVEVNRDAVRDPAHLESLVSKLKKGDDLLLLIYRKGGWTYQVVRL